MDKKIIEEVLQKIIDIDEKTTGYNQEVQVRIEHEKELLKRAKEERKYKYNKLMEQEGKKIYDEKIRIGEEASDKIHSQYEKKAQSLERIFAEKKDTTVEKIVNKLFGDKDE